MKASYAPRSKPLACELECSVSEHVSPPFLLAETMVKSIDAFEARNHRGRINLSLNAASVTAIPDYELRQDAMRFTRRVALVLSGKGDLGDTELSRFAPQTPTIKGLHKQQERLVTASVTLRWLEKPVQLHKERPVFLDSKSVFKDMQRMGELFVGLLWHESAEENAPSSSSAEEEVDMRGLRMMRTVGSHFWLMDMDVETGDPKRSREGVHNNLSIPAINGQAKSVHYAVTLSLRHCLERQSKKRSRSASRESKVPRLPSAATTEPRLKKQKQPISFRLKTAKVIPMQLKQSPQWNSPPPPVTAHMYSNGGRGGSSRGY